MTAELSRHRGAHRDNDNALLARIVAHGNDIAQRAASLRASLWHGAARSAALCRVRHRTLDTSTSFSAALHLFRASCLAALRCLRRSFAHLHLFS